MHRTCTKYVTSALLSRKINLPRKISAQQVFIGAENWVRDALLSQKIADSSIFSGQRCAISADSASVVPFAHTDGWRFP